MSAEHSTDIELYTGLPYQLTILPPYEPTELFTDQSLLLEFPLHPEHSESALKIRVDPDEMCVPECPIIQHAISEIMSESDEAVVQSLKRWIEYIHSACQNGPQKSTRPRFFVVGAEIVEITCGSLLSRHHPKQQSIRTSLR